MNIMNEKPFEYTVLGTTFKADRCDFKGGIKVNHKIPQHTFPFANAVAEMVGYHATNIHPNLNGFQGYDCINWIFEE